MATFKILNISESKMKYSLWFKKFLVLSAFFTKNSNILSKQKHCCILSINFHVLINIQCTSYFDKQFMCDLLDMDK